MADYDPWYLPQSVCYLIQCAIKTTVRQSHMSTPSVATASHKDVSAIKHLTEHNDSNLLPPSRTLPLSCQCFDGNVGEAALECSLAAVALTILALPVSRPRQWQHARLALRKTNYPAWLFLPWACTYPLKQSTRLITMTMPADNAVCTSTSERQDRLGEDDNENTRESTERFETEYRRN